METHIEVEVEDEEEKGKRLFKACLDPNGNKPAYVARLSCAILRFWLYLAYCTGFPNKILTLFGRLFLQLFKT